MDVVFLQSNTSDTITVSIKGGYLSVGKIANTIDKINDFIKPFPKCNNLVIDYAHEISPDMYAEKTYLEYKRLECDKVNIKFGDLNINSNLPHKFKNISFTPVETFSKRYKLALTKWHKDLEYELDYKRDFNRQCSKKFNSIILFLGRSGKEHLLKCRGIWNFEYKEKKSLTNPDSKIIKIYNLKKK